MRRAFAGNGFFDLVTEFPHVKSFKDRFAFTQKDRPHREMKFVHESLFQILSNGLSTTTDRRGCKPSDIKTFAAISVPMKAPMWMKAPRPEKTCV